MSIEVLVESSVTMIVYCTIMPFCCCGAGGSHLRNSAVALINVTDKLLGTPDGAALRGKKIIQVKIPLIGSAYHPVAFGTLLAGLDQCLQ